MGFYLWADQDRYRYSIVKIIMLLRSLPSPDLFPCHATFWFFPLLSSSKGFSRKIEIYHTEAITARTIVRACRNFAVEILNLSHMPSKQGSSDVYLIDGHYCFSEIRKNKTYIEGYKTTIRFDAKQKLYFPNVFYFN